MNQVPSWQHFGYNQKLLKELHDGQHKRYAACRRSHIFCFYSLVVINSDYITWVILLDFNEK